MGRVSVLLPRQAKTPVSSAATQKGGGTPVLLTASIDAGASDAGWHPGGILAAFDRHWIGIGSALDRHRIGIGSAFDLRGAGRYGNGCGRAVACSGI